jgi:competence protein ComEC
MTTLSAHLHVLDVAHGNCAIATGADWAVMIDAAPNVAVVEAVERLGLTRLDVLVVSHRDHDHTRGVVPLLARKQLEIGVIYISTDAAKDPRAPETALLLAALEDAKRSERCCVSRDLDNTFSPSVLSGGGVKVDVLAPTFEIAMTGPKGKSSTGVTMSSNSASAVLRITLEDGLRILLPGDLDRVGLAELRNKHIDLSADVLVFPHHGSLSTVPDERAFAAEVMRAVRARTVLFSVGRAAKARPTTEMLRGVFDADPMAEIACTQLSSGCLAADADLPDELIHLTNLPAAGRADCRSCAGSMILGHEGLKSPDVAAHQEYIDAVAKTPMCRVVRPAEHTEASR